MGGRYDGKPFLRLLDSYVLDAIGQLADTQKSGLEGLQPRLEKTYQTQGTWQQIVASQMDFPEGFQGQIRQIWDRYLEHAKSAGAAVDPNEFVQRFVDENFPGI